MGCSRSPSGKQVDPKTKVCKSTNSEEDPRLILNITIKGEIFKALLDTGATRSYASEVSAKRVQKLGLAPTVENNMYATLADGKRVVIPSSFKVLCTISQRVKEIQLLILPGLTVDIIIGLETMKEWGVIIDVSNKQIYWSSTTPQYHVTTTSELKVVDKLISYIFAMLFYCEI